MYSNNGRVVLEKSEIPVKPVSPAPRWFIRVISGITAALVLFAIGPFLALYAGFCYRLFSMTAH